MPRTRKVIKTRMFRVRIPPGLPIEKAYEKFTEVLKTPYSEVSIERDGSIRIKIVGTEHEIKESWLRLRNTVNELWELYKFMISSEAGIDLIAREIGRTFPPEALLYALKLRGYSAQLLENNTIKSNAPYNKILSIARDLVKVLDEIRFQVKGSSAKKLIAALCAGLQENVERIIDIGLKSGIFLKDENDRVYLRIEWRQALRKLAVLLRTGKEYRLS